MFFAFADESPLHFAAESGSIEIVKLLLDHGANVQQRDKYGETFLVLLLCWQIQLPFMTHRLFTGSHLDVQRKAKVSAINLLVL